MIKTAAIATELDAPFIQEVTDLFEQKITFNQVLGIKLVEIKPDRVTARLPMREDLIGHYLHQRIHGGVISACLDALGGIAIMAAVGARHLDESVEQRMKRFMKLGTIDLRIDYLRPGVGAHFELSADVLRLGSRVGSTRMEFRGADGRLMATGSGAYIMS
jgi:uncharacterized protein (TIGR00369 family)